MANDAKQRRRELFWNNTARRKRPAVSKLLAQALGCSPQGLVFSDLDRTDHVLFLFGQAVGKAAAEEVPDREHALRILRQTFDDCDVIVALLHSEYHNCGVVDVRLPLLMDRLEEYLTSQHEQIGFITWNGKLGACVVSQEGSAPHFPRTVQCWTHGDGSTE